MILLKWVDINDRVFICNPNHVISVSTGSACSTSFVNFVGGYYIEIYSIDTEKFIEKWLLALNKEK